MPQKQACTARGAANAVPILPAICAEFVPVARQSVSTVTAAMNVQIMTTAKTAAQAAYLTNTTIVKVAAAANCVPCCVRTATGGAWTVCKTRDFIARDAVPAIQR